MPATASMILWNNRGNLIQPDSQIKIHGISHDSIQKFIELLLNAQNDFAAGSNLQTLHQIKVFEKQNADYFASLGKLTGRSFPISLALTSPNTMFGDYLSSSDLFFYWD